MKAFRGTAPHAKVMPRLVEWCDEASYPRWTPSGASVPSGPEAYEHLLAEGGSLAWHTLLPLMTLGNLRSLD